MLAGYNAPIIPTESVGRVLANVGDLVGEARQVLDLLPTAATLAQLDVRTRAHALDGAPGLLDGIGATPLGVLPAHGREKFTTMLRDAAASMRTIADALQERRVNGRTSSGNDVYMSLVGNNTLSPAKYAIDNRFHALRATVEDLG